MKDQRHIRTTPHTWWSRVDQTDTVLLIRRCTWARICGPTELPDEAVECPWICLPYPSPPRTRNSSSDGRIFSIPIYPRHSLTEYSRKWVVVYLEITSLFPRLISYLFPFYCLIVSQSFCHEVEVEIGLKLIPRKISLLRIFINFEISKFRYRALEFNYVLLFITYSIIYIYIFVFINIIFSFQVNIVYDDLKYASFKVMSIYLLISDPIFKLI